MADKAIKQVICEELMKKAADDRDITVLCSDSRGSGSMAPFAEGFPAQFVEVGIAEQNLVSLAAGMARAGKRSFAVSPACFLSTRSLEQIKVDVAYSNANVKLLGISGGVSYGALGMTHHSANDIAALSSIPNLRVYLPSDGRMASALMAHLLDDEAPAYIRMGRNPVPALYNENLDFAMDRAITAREGNDICIVACGELVRAAVEAADRLAKEGISCRVLDMYCVKPIDEEAILKAAGETRAVITIEEHSLYGGLGARVCQLLSEKSCPVRCLALPDAPVIAGKSQEVFDHYGLNAEGLMRAAREML